MAKMAKMDSPKTPRPKLPALRKIISDNESRNPAEENAKDVNRPENRKILLQIAIRSE